MIAVPTVVDRKGDKSVHIRQMECFHCVCSSCPSEHLHINDNWKDEASKWLGTGAFWRHQSFTSQASWCEPGHYGGRAWETLLMMECRLVRLLLSASAARELDSAHATSPCSPDQLGPACVSKQNNTHLPPTAQAWNVEGRSLVRKWRPPAMAGFVTAGDRGQTLWDTSKMDIVAAVGFCKTEKFIRSQFIRSASDSWTRHCSLMGWAKCGRQDLHPSRWLSPWVFSLLAFKTLHVFRCVHWRAQLSLCFIRFGPRRWRTRRPSCGSPSWGTAGTTRRGTVSPTFATHSSSTPTSTWETRRD